MPAPESFLADLATRTAAAMGEVLATVAGGAVEVETATFALDADGAFEGLQVPLILSEVAYGDGITGGNLVAVPLGVGHQLAQVMGVDAGDDPGAISDAALAAVGEVANRMLASAAATTAEIVGQRVDLTTPTTRLIRELKTALTPYQVVRHVTSMPFTILGEDCRLVQFVPQAFVARMTALDDEELGDEDAQDDQPAAQQRPEAVPPTSMARTTLRVGVELGRTHMTVGQITGLPHGAIVTLDRKATDPIDICVNGVPFAFGRLVRGERGIAVVIEGFTGQASVPAPAPAPAQAPVSAPASAPVSAAAVDRAA